MTAFAPKRYQSELLASVESYFRACHEFGSPAQAYTATTERLWGRGNPYHIALREAAETSRDYDPTTSSYGHFDFQGHYYPRIGDFDSREEFECACRLDILTQQGRLAFWVRNLVRREGASFFLQKANGRFYPDFLCRLPEQDSQLGPVLAIEYKGAQGWNDAKEDRLIGDLWANLSPAAAAAS